MNGDIEPIALERRLGGMEGALHEILSRMGRIDEHLAALNGSVARHSERWRELEKKEAFEAGRREAGAATVVTRRQLALVGGTLSFLVGVATAAANVILKVL